MQTGFALRDKGQARASAFRVGDQPCHNRSLPHHGLLCAFPSVWVREDKLRTGLQAAPQLDAVAVRLFDVEPRALEQVAQKVSENIDRGLALGQGRNVLSDMRGRFGLWSEVQLEPIYSAFQPDAARKGDVVPFCLDPLCIVVVVVFEARV